MHEISTYNDEDKAELLMRCRLLTFNHKWQFGDYLWDAPDHQLLIIHQLFEKNDDWANFILEDGSGFSAGHIFEEGVWLPTEGQIMDMDGWNRVFNIRSTDKGWCVFRGTLIAAHIDAKGVESISQHRILAMLRAVQGEIE